MRETLACAREKALAGLLELCRGHLEALAAVESAADGFQSLAPAALGREPAPIARLRQLPAGG